MSDIDRLQNAQEAAGQFIDEMNGSYRKRLSGSAPPSGLRANLENYQIAHVVPEGGVTVTRFTNHSATPGRHRFGELFGGCMERAECRAKMLRWFREQTGETGKSTFVVVLPDQGSSSSAELVTFDFLASEVVRRIRHSGFVEQGEMVIVGKTFPASGVFRFGPPPKQKKKKKQED